MLKHQTVRYETQEGESCRYRVVSRDNPSIRRVYTNVGWINEGFDDNHNLCFQIEQFNGDTATFPTCEWRIQHETFVDI